MSRDWVRRLTRTAAGSRAWPRAALSGAVPVGAWVVPLPNRNGLFVGGVVGGVVTVSPSVGGGVCPTVRAGVWVGHAPVGGSSGTSRGVVHDPRRRSGAHSGISGVSVVVHRVAGMVAPPRLERISVAEAVRRYLAAVEVETIRGVLSPATARSYSRDVREFGRLAGGERVLDDV